MVRDLVSEVVGMSPYERRLLDMLKTGGAGSEKRMYKFAKRRVSFATMVVFLTVCETLCVCVRVCLHNCHRLSFIKLFDFVALMPFSVLPLFSWELTEGR